MLVDAIGKRPEETVRVAITGPGDPLAVPDTLLQTINLVRDRYPRLRISLKTLGCGARRFAADLARAGVDYVEMVVNGVTGEILEKIYAWIRPGLKTMTLQEAAYVLITEQKHGIPALKYQGIGVVVVTTLYPGCNVHHVNRIAAAVQELGADALALVPYRAEPDGEVVLEPGEVDPLEHARWSVPPAMPIVSPLLADDDGYAGNYRQGAARLPRPSLLRPLVAVASSGGLDVDLHLGRAERLLIYGCREDGLVCLRETRPAPQPGSGRQRWQDLSDLLSDCCALLTVQAGETPRRVLQENGVRVMLTDGQIEPLVEQIFGGDKGGRSAGGKPPR
ncbi:nitrogen fixation protein NifB [Desulfofustis glycolicus DSM 9705]|uniref:Nitrogen fixation protein NifB n=2 Tax=Desulfofustis glycolicus TaxID=51195 RepID=A0A1M5XUL2_9BACT|nr:nitrogen fixation protein NifB [Desulfofustis glycolicus DSM 9705]